MPDSEAQEIFPCVPRYVETQVNAMPDSEMQVTAMPDSFASVRIFFRNYRLTLLRNPSRNCVVECAKSTSTVPPFT